MKLISNLHCFALAAMLFGVYGWPQHQTIPGKWYKGNLHAHSYWSDGDEFPEVIMDWYQSNGYNFTVLSDHNTLAEGDKWVVIGDRKYLQDGFKAYLKKYGDSWVVHRRDSAGRIEVKLKTLAEYNPLFEKYSDFLIIRSEEVTTGYEDRPIHINATNIQQLITPETGENKVQIIQNNINAILKQRRELSTPIMPHINHPNFQYGIDVSDFVQLKGVQFFEVYNGHPLVNNTGDSTHLGTEAMWDTINIAYLKKGQPLLYGIATDDSHQYHQFGKQYSNAGRGWVMVRAESLTSPDLIAAMEAGEFYASTGVRLKTLEYRDNLMSVGVIPEPGVSYNIEIIGVDRVSGKSRVLHSVKGNSASFAVTADFLFVRVRITSDRTNKNFFDESEYEKAWTQPVSYKIK